MRDKELRLAIVCYGGVSLAVYMHGVTKEIQKLARSSKVFHAMSHNQTKKELSYSDVNDDRHRQTDTEIVYYDLLNYIADKGVNLRVIVDVVAGASAGGVNGVALARALALDLPLDSHRDMWLRLADTTELIEPQNQARPWTKFYLRPILWGLIRAMRRNSINDPEISSKLSQFFRARWFQPPFSGKRFTNMLFEAFEAMHTPATDQSLLPKGHQLDLFVTVTDFYGYEHNLAIHDPTIVREREHRHVLQFSYLRNTSGLLHNEFDREYIPGLAFAARATSSFAGAFPPLQLAEIEETLAVRQQSWTRREEFLEKQFAGLYGADHDISSSVFIDGGVLDNKPFAAAINALNARPAHREVDRRLIYIEPNPYADMPKVGNKPPGFFNTLRSAFSVIPRNQPIRDNIEWIDRQNERTRTLKQVIAAVRPDVSSIVKAILDQYPIDGEKLESIALWRDLANQEAVAQSGYAYDGYIQLKVKSVVDNLAAILCDVARCARHSDDELVITKLIEDWAHRSDVFPVKRIKNPSNDSANAVWIDFLKQFDVHFRIRRLRQLIRRANELYQQSEATVSTQQDIEYLGYVKANLYDELEFTTKRLNRDYYSDEIRSKVSGLVALHDGLDAVIENILERLGIEMNLTSTDHNVDEIVSMLHTNELNDHIREELLLDYLSFPFVDVLILPMHKWREFDEFDEIKVVRISPEDTYAFRTAEGLTALKGVKFNRFGAFFSRRYRENDYLWGRLHAAERLVDTIVDAAREHIDIPPSVRASFKTRLFDAILDAEETELHTISKFIKELRPD